MNEAGTISNKEIFDDAAKELKGLGYTVITKDRARMIAALMFEHKDKDQRIILMQNDMGILEYWERLTDENCDALTHPHQIAEQREAR